MGKPSGVEPAKEKPESVEQSPALEPHQPAPSGIGSPEVAHFNSESEDRGIPPVIAEDRAANVDEQADAEQPIAPPEPPVIESRQPQQRPVTAPSRPASDARQASHRPSQPLEKGTSPEPASTREFRPASPRSVQEAIEDVNAIIETLKSSLEDMEELLETLELAERQKDADEQEIESLRRSLRQLNRPRESGRRDPGHREGGQGETGHRDPGHHREGGHRR